ncbi:hypothetical protein GYA13_04720 [Candidatus Kuenenbacteria bacterium]|nr:hypothetical protein [Candidatus Kuenenbacteria bacterium]
MSKKSPGEIGRDLNEIAEIIDGKRVQYGLELVSRAAEELSRINADDPNNKITFREIKLGLMKTDAQEEAVLRDGINSEGQKNKPELLERIDQKIDAVLGIKSDNEISNLRTSNIEEKDGGDMPTIDCNIGKIHVKTKNTNGIYTVLIDDEAVGDPETATKIHERLRKICILREDMTLDEKRAELFKEFKIDEKIKTILGIKSVKEMGKLRTPNIKERDDGDMSTIDCNIGKIHVIAQHGLVFIDNYPIFDVGNQEMAKKIYEHLKDLLTQER